MRFIEIKSSETLSKDHIKNIASLKALFPRTENFVVYSGQEVANFHNVQFVNWGMLNALHRWRRNATISKIETIAGN